MFIVKAKMGSGESKELSQDQLDEIRTNTRFTGSEIKEWYDKFHQDYPDGVIKKEEFIEVGKKKLSIILNFDNRFHL